MKIGLNTRLAAAVLAGGLLTWALAAPGQPIFSLSANGTVNPQLCRGWPLMVEAALLHPQAFAESVQPLSIAAPAAPWSEAIKLEVHGPNGQLVNWPLRLYNTTGPLLVLDRTTAGRLVWFVAPEQTSGWPEGTYELVGRLDTTGSPPTEFAWQGVLDSVPVVVQVSAEPPTLSEPLLEQKQRIFAQYYSLRADPGAALNAAQQLLAASPTNLAGFTMAAVLEEAAGRLNDSLAASTSGLAEFFKRYPDPEEPPAELLRLKSRVYKALFHGQLHAPAVRGNSLEVSWEALPGLSFRVQTSTDLINWTDCSATVSSTTGQYLWSGALSSDAHFFRVSR